MSDFPRALRSSFLTGLVISCCAICGCGKSQKSESVSGEKPTKPATVGLRVSVEQLKPLLDNDSVRILDVRQQAKYDAAHIPGAVHVDLAAWKNQALKEDGKGLTDKAAWESLVRGAGINNFTPVVVYAENPTNATRVWWTLKYLGVESAGILDGGWNAWKTAGGKTATDSPKIAPGNFTVEFHPDRLAVIDDLKKDYQNNDVQVVDTRSTGEVAAGKIPGATPLEWKELIAEDGRFKSNEELKAIFADRGLSPEKTAITYCQTGGRASLDAYALELAGFKNVKNYYCSWQQWSKAKTPVEKP